MAKNKQKKDFSEKLKDYSRILLREDSPLWRSGRDCRLFDHKQREVYDFILSGGSQILGHAHRNIILGAKTRLERGVYLQKNFLEEYDFARWLLDHLPGFEKLHFFSSEYMAQTAAVKAAQQLTGKKIVLKTWNAEEIASCKDLAGVILPGLDIRQGIKPLDKVFFETVKGLSQKSGFKIILDETLSGFRFGSYALYSSLGLKPDMLLLGGVISSGFSLGALAGDKEVLESVYRWLKEEDICERISPAVLRAGFIQLRTLNDSAYQKIENTAKHLEQRIQRIVSSEPLVDFSRFHSVMKIVFKQNNTGQNQELCYNLERYQTFRAFMLEQRILLPDQAGVFFVSLAHSRKALTAFESGLGLFMQKEVE